MKRIILIPACFLFFASTILAQEREKSGMIKTTKGILVVWNEPDNYYTIEIKGKQITPAEQPLLFQVDGLFFQIQTAEKKAFLQGNVDKKLDDKTILATHRDWEGDYLSGVLKKKLQIDSEWLKLADGTDALGWSYDMPRKMVPDGQSAKKQFYLAVVKRNHVLLLNSALTGDDNDKTIRQLLLDTINTLRSTDKPLPLQKAAEMIRNSN